MPYLASEGTAMTTALCPSLSPNARAALESATLRIGHAASAARLWEQVLTDADRSRLDNDLPTAWACYGTAGMWQRLRGVSAGRAVVDVARALNFLDESTQGWLLRELGESDEDPDIAIERAAAHSALVLVERPRAAYWQGQVVSVDWDRQNASWDFLWELARLAKAGQAIDRTTFPTAKDPAVVNKRKHRLVNLAGFPLTLADRIQEAGRYTLRLDLAPADIRRFELDFSETVKERTA